MTTEAPESDVQTILETEKPFVTKARKEAEEKAKELEAHLQCKVTTLLYPLDDETEDVAIAYLRHPDAVQTLKLLKAFSENEENGTVLIAKAHLIRTWEDEEGSKVVSDPRFMDVNGKYDTLNDSGINASLLLECRKLLVIYQNFFKKK